MIAWCYQALLEHRSHSTQVVAWPWQVACSWKLTSASCNINIASSHAHRSSCSHMQLHATCHVTLYNHCDKIHAWDQMTCFQQQDCETCNRVVQARCSIVAISARWASAATHLRYTHQQLTNPCRKFHARYTKPQLEAHCCTCACSSLASKEMSQHRRAQYGMQFCHYTISCSLYPSFWHSVSEHHIPFQ